MRHTVCIKTCEFTRRFVLQVIIIQHVGHFVKSECVGLYLAHAWCRNSAECPDEVSLDARRRFKGEYTRSSEQVHWHLQ